MRALICLALLLSLRVAQTTNLEEVYPHLPGEALLPSSRSSLCTVVRTYWGHDKGAQTGLLDLLESLRRQTMTRWEAVIVVMDSTPFYGLASILKQLHDDRIWVYAEWIGHQFAPKADGVWLPNYHQLLYDLTDEAIRACSPHTRWVVVTNGDNEYAATAFSKVMAVGTGVDIVAMDFYSRYQRSTGPPCTRFSQADYLPPCKVNKLVWCQTDLGANALNWPRLVAEGRRFGGLAAVAGNLTADHFDGVMAETLVAAGWRAEHLSGQCLFEHDPSPQRCARLGGVWDDTLSHALNSPGGSCISAATAEERLSQEGHELIEVQLSNDGRLAEYLAPEQSVKPSIGCLRDGEVDAIQEYAWTFFGERCSADYDIEVRSNETCRS